MNAIPHTLAAVGNLDIDALYYQITGMVVVFTCLCFLSLILTISGSIAKRLEASQKAKQAAAKAALAAAQPAAPAPVAAAPAAAEPTPAQVAALAASIYNTAASSITPELVAAIAAAVKVTVGQESRILSIKPVDAGYAQGGRSSIMNSHQPRRG